MKPNIDLNVATTTKVVKLLSCYLADLSFLYLKTHCFHWNVKGLHFYSLHKLFEDQYQALFGALDEVAERIRALGEPVPGTYHQFQKLSCLQEQPDISQDKDMIKILLEDHETLIRNLRQAIEETNNAGDLGSGDFLTTRLEDHEKMAWMLRSHFE
jgi:starvation-inducible DNA-binding protein